MRKVGWIALIGCLVLLGANEPAYAWHADGRVVCDSNQNGLIDSTDLPLANVRVTVVSTGKPYFDGTMTRTVLTDSAGNYIIELPDGDTTFNISLDVATLPASPSILIPGSNPYSALSTIAGPPRIDWLVFSPACAPGKCWLTGGGAKFSPLVGQGLAEKGPQHSFGGNVNPGCNTDSGEGGQWNHIAHSLKLHFQGWVVRVVRCGNVPGIPPGSESPQTPFNFIEFEGEGTLKGIQGNKVDYGPVTFFARAEDRNEPGSSGNRDGALIDRYFLRVVDGGGTTRLLIDVDGNPATVDPVLITDGNLQIHISSCETP